MANALRRRADRLEARQADYDSHVKSWEARRNLISGNGAFTRPGSLKKPYPLGTRSAGTNGRPWGRKTQISRRVARYARQGR